MIRTPRAAVGKTMAQGEKAMLRTATIYLATLIPFAVIDFLWLSVMGPRLYRPTLGDMALDGVRWAPAVAFYLLYPVGLLLFAVLPGQRDGQPLEAAIAGALFGLFAYATYDLTNYATLRNWSWQMTLADMAWGAVLSGVSSLIAVLAARRLAL
jgi:uncharacterized membrane protein